MFTPDGERGDREQRGYPFNIYKTLKAVDTSKHRADVRMYFIAIISFVFYFSVLYISSVTGSSH